MILSLLFRLVFLRFHVVDSAAKFYCFACVAAYIQRIVTLQAASHADIKTVVDYKIAVFGAVRFCVPYAVRALCLSVPQRFSACFANAAADCQRVVSLLFFRFCHFLHLMSCGGTPRRLLDCGDYEAGTNVIVRISRAGEVAKTTAADNAEISG